MAKQLKPGQLCTINRCVLRCKKESTDSACDHCQRENNELCIIGSIFSDFIYGSDRCATIFGMTNYPVLVK